MLALTYISFVPLSTYMPLTFRALGLDGVEWYFLGVGLTGTVARLRATGVVVERYPTDKDATDLELALDLALAGLPPLPGGEPGARA